MGKKLFEAIGENCIFVQQYDAFTMEPSLQGVKGEQDAYGPAMLAVLEYISRMYGVNISRDKVYWGSLECEESSYEQLFEGRSYKLEQAGGKAAGYVDGKEVFTCEQGSRVVTDLEGNRI